MSSTKHKAGARAAHGCQAAALSLTATRLRGLKWACQVESQKNGGFLALVEHGVGPTGAVKPLCEHAGVVRAQRWPSHSSSDRDHMAKMILTHTLASARTATVWLLPSARLRW